MEHTQKLLKDFTVIDFSHRLPGPMSSLILKNLGAKVIKIEDQKFQDSFLSGLFADFDSNFKDWYKELNKDKEIVRLDFKSDNIKNELAPYIDKADMIIMSLPEKLKVKCGLTNEDLNKSYNSKAIIEMLASKSTVSAMHDLNAMAVAGILTLHAFERTEDILAPPFLPFAGINFGHKVATDLIACCLLAKTSNKNIFHTSYLLETTQELYSPFFKNTKGERKKFLHNGLYPCYCMYRTKDDKYVALAAVEEKFWNRFVEVFKVDVSTQNRFNKEKLYFEKISKVFKSMTIDEIDSLNENENFCLSTIDW